MTTYKVIPECRSDGKMPIISGEITSPPSAPGGGLPTMKSKQYCIWTEDEDGVYQTSCLYSFEIINGTPETNGIKYCPYCGNLIRQAGEP